MRGFFFSRSASISLGPRIRRSAVRRTDTEVRVCISGSPQENVAAHYTRHTVVILGMTPSRTLVLVLVLDPTRPNPSSTSTVSLGTSTIEGRRRVRGSSLRSPLSFRFSYNAIHKLQWANPIVYSHIFVEIQGTPTSSLDGIDHRSLSVRR